MLRVVVGTPPAVRMAWAGAIAWRCMASMWNKNAQVLPPCKRRASCGPQHGRWARRWNAAQSPPDVSTPRKTPNLQATSMQMLLHIPLKHQLQRASSLTRCGRRRMACAGHCGGHRHCVRACMACVGAGITRCAAASAPAVWWRNVCDTCRREAEALCCSCGACAVHLTLCPCVWPVDG